MEWPDASIHDSEKNRKELAYVIRLLRPKLVITHHWNCRHPDHIGASKVVERTCMLSGLKKYLEEDKDAPAEWRPDRVLFFGGWHNKNPSAIVDISDHFRGFSGLIPFASTSSKPVGSKRPKSFKILIWLSRPILVATIAVPTFYDSEMISETLSIGPL